MGAFAQAPGGPARRVDALQVGLTAALLALAALAWVSTSETTAGMDAGPGGDLGSLSFFLGAWVVMMAAMMLPSIVPTVRAYALLGRRRAAPHRPGEAGAEIVAFLGGYLAIWTGFGPVAYAALELVRALDVHAFSWDRGGRYLAGGVILAAALYQLSPPKDACLARCRGQRDFLGERWRGGVGAALRLGLEHGAWCVGCCWALMAALFALGVMSVAWMAVIAALIAAERLLPWRAPANRGVAIVLVVLGSLVTLAGLVP